TPPGTYKLIATYNANISYTGSVDVSQSLVVNPAPLSVTPANKSRAYGANNPTLTGTLTGLKSGDTITATYSTAGTPASPAGTYSIIPALVDPTNKLTNYTVILTNGTLTVGTPPAQTLTVTVGNASRSYGDANPAFSGTISGIVSGDNITVSYSTTANVSSP